MAFAFGLAALLFACILNPSGVGVGTVRPLFSRSQGELVVANGDDYAWDAVSIRPNFLWNGDVEGVPHLARGGAHRVSLGSGGILGFDLPLLVLVTCDKPGGGRSGFWIGLAG
jgi:hypothetical protein